MTKIGKYSKITAIPAWWAWVLNPGAVFTCTFVTLTDALFYFLRFDGFGFFG